MTLDTVSGPEQPPLMPNANGMVQLTPAAAARVRYLLNQKDPQPEALLISVKTKGCSGLSYDLQYLDHLKDKPKFADEIHQHGVTIVIDPKASLFLVGSVMDYKESPTASGFDFANPNETGRCGCGESFTVAPELVGKS